MIPVTILAPAHHFGYGVRAAQNWQQDAKDHRLAVYVEACELAAERLTLPEKETLRQTGRLPRWFLREVRLQAKVVKRRMRGTAF